jgi:hypothetical protein
MPTQFAAYSIPRDSNLNYLPFMYILPFESVSKYPTLRRIPRCLGEVARSQKFIDLIDSDQFLNEIIDAVSALAFPHFGFGGWKEHYTGYSPVWQLSNALNLWTHLLEQETGWGLQRLLRIPADEVIPYFDPDFIKDVMSRIVKRGISEHGLQPILDVVREMPCHEDFEDYRTNVRIDFYRKWYHTRSKIKMVSLEICMSSEDDEGDAGDFIEFTVADTRRDIAVLVESDDYIARFKALLSDKDRTILEMREDGYTFEEIAGKLDYKNHSGVVKRMQAIKEAYLEYESKNK